MYMVPFQTSPCDGRILYFGKAERGVLEQVKGITYSLQDFMGPQTWPGGQQRTAALSSSQHPADPQVILTCLTLTTKCLLLPGFLLRK